MSTTPRIQDRASLPSSERLDIVRDLGERYEVADRAEYGNVWFGRAKADGRRVAIKHLPSGSEGESFYRELHTLMRIDDPGVVRLVDLEEAEDGSRYLVLEHCTGENLRTSIERRRGTGEAIALESARSTIAGIASGLVALHRAGHIHADLKPENVVLQEPGSAQAGNDTSARTTLIDFGHSETTKGERPEGALCALAGTPHYMAPERFRGELGVASDLYSLGVIAYELLHGKRPFEGEVGEIARGHLHGVPVIDPALPEDWRELLGLLLAKDPIERLDDAGAVRDCVLAFKSEESAMPPQWAPLPKDTLGIWTDPREGTVHAVTAGGLATPSQPGSLDSWSMVPWPSGETVVAYHQGAEGYPWVATETSVYRVREGGTFEHFTSQWAPTEALLTTDDGALVLLTADRIESFSIQSGAQRWSTRFHSPGVSPMAAALPGGRVALGVGTLQPTMTIFGPAGRRELVAALAGVPWGVAAGSFAEAPCAHVDVVAGDRMRSLRLDASTGSAQPMLPSRVVCARATGPLGELLLCRSGELFLNGSTVQHIQIPEGARATGLAFQNHHHALVVVEIDGRNLCASVPTQPLP